MSTFLENLNDDGAPQGTIESDCCIVGAGPAGLTLARALADHGLTVTLVDRGAHRPCEAAHEEALEFVRNEYRGATIGRAFGWGGTSALWGGQLMPVRADDLEARPWCGKPPWPIGASEIERYLPKLHDWLGVSRSNYDSSVLRSLGHPLGALEWGVFSPRFSKWIRFSARNLAVAWRGILARSGRVRVLVNARVTGGNSIDGDQGRSLSAIHVESPRGRKLRVEANRVILAAGALASTALVQRLSDGVVSSSSTGSLSDHLSLRIAEVDVRDPSAWRTLFAPFFEGDTMRSLRMEMPLEHLRSKGLPAFYVHFVSETPEKTGFANLRCLFRELQRRDVAGVLRNAIPVVGSLPEIAAIAWWRYARRRLYHPAGSRTFVHVDFEQNYDAENWVEGIGAASDGLRIAWAPGAPPETLVSSVSSSLQDFWLNNLLCRVARLRFLSPSELAACWPNNAHDIFHPACTLPMGTSLGRPSVDSDGRVTGFSNLYLASSAAFPSMGAANPTLTVMALALRIADSIAESCEARK